jgi:predicted RNA-binding protein YlqC (UPF0109 family)
MSDVEPEDDVDEDEDEDEFEDEDDFDDDDEDDEDDDANRVPAATATAVLDYLVRAVVDDPDSVVIDPTEGRNGITLQVRVAPGDMGRVIGKRGRVANSIRTVVRAAAAKDGVDADVDFVD